MINMTNITNQGWPSQVAQLVKNPSAVQQTRVWVLGWEVPLEKGMATHSTILAWRIPTDRGAWRATVHGSQRVRHNWETNHSPTRAPIACGLMKLTGWWRKQAIIIEWWWWVSRCIMSDSCDPMDGSPPVSLCPWDLPGRNTGEGSHFLLQGIFLT